MPSVPYLDHTLARPTCTGGISDPHVEMDMWSSGWDPTGPPGYKLTVYYHCRRCGRRLVLGITQNTSEAPPGWVPEV
jgi:hypothetical protein